MKKLLLIMLAMMLVLIAQAEVDGSKGFQVLRLMVNPVTAAQGGNGALNSTSSYTFIDNAAAPMMNKGKSISVSQNTMWVFDTSLTGIAYTNSKGKSSFGYGIRYLDYGKIDNYDDTGINYGEYHPMDLILTFNFGYRIMANQYLGVNISGLYEQIDDASSAGIAGDLGYVYKTPVKDLSVTAAVKNLGYTGKMDKENIELPVTMEMGLNKDFYVNTNRISASGKLTKDIDNDELTGSLGVEANLYENFFIRSGYKLGYELEGYSGGFGVKFKRIMIDYAYCAMAEDMDDMHIMGLSWKF